MRRRNQRKKRKSWMRWLFPRIAKTIAIIAIVCIPTTFLMLDWRVIQANIWSGLIASILFTLWAAWTIEREESWKSAFLAIAMAFIGLISFFGLPDWVLTFTVATVMIKGTNAMVRTWIPSNWF